MKPTSPNADGIREPEEIRLQRRWWHEIPMWAFYVPVAAGIVAMMVRHRSFNAPLCANHGLANGGLFPGSKDAFFALFGEDHPLLPRQIRLDAGLPAEEALNAYQRFMQQIGTHHRAVLKPDEGIQGMAVHMIGSSEDFARFWQQAAADGGKWLLQEFVGGIEAGLFYVREDESRPGRIVSMTLKRGYETTGDGETTIAGLIELANSDAATRKRVLRYNGHRLAEIPEKGSALDLMPVRNHHLGATFQDLTDFITAELEAAVIPHLDAIEGYNYGRLDVRAPDYRALFAGRDIRVLEANALYSEPVHAYDPRYGFGKAIAIFLSHWAMAFRAGMANKRAGRRQIPFSRVFRPEK